MLLAFICRFLAHMNRLRCAGLVCVEASQQGEDLWCGAVLLHVLLASAQGSQKCYDESDADVHATRKTQAMPACV